MDKRSLILVGAALILLGLLAMVFTGVTAVLGWNVGILFARLWPVLVIGVGLGFVVPPLVVRGKPGLGALFIPGFPILMTGSLLFLASVTNAWGIWAWLWPMQLLAVATGFFFAAVYMRVIWLVIPAIIIGLNGMVFQFCAITGLWAWWSVLWIIEPLAVGLALLVPGVVKDVRGLKLAGVILCGLAGGFFMLMVTVLGGWWPIRLVGGGLLVLGGLGVLGWVFLRPTLAPRSALE